MVNSKRRFPEKPDRRRPLPVQRRYLHGGTLVNMVAALIFFGLLGLGLWWVIASSGGMEWKFAAIPVSGW